MTNKGLVFAQVLVCLADLLFLLPLDTPDDSSSPPCADVLVLVLELLLHLLALLPPSPTPPSMLKEGPIVVVSHQRLHIVAREEPCDPIHNSLPPAIVVLLDDVNDCVLREAQLVLLVGRVVINCNDFLQVVGGHRWGIRAWDTVRGWVVIHGFLHEVRGYSWRDVSVAGRRWGQGGRRGTRRAAVVLLLTHYPRGGW